jgi:hypothetical protein
MAKNSGIACMFSGDSELAEEEGGIVLPIGAWEVRGR